MINTFENESLYKLRKKLTSVDELMKRGIMKDCDTKLEYFTGYSYNTLYDWDQYFEAIVQIYMGWPSTYIKNGVIIFLEKQKDSGLISRSVPSNLAHDPEHVKPFLAQICLLVYKAYGEIDWIIREPYFSRLKKYIDYWTEEMDEDKNGLSEWMSSPHTGMDNQHERAGYWRDRFCEGVDLNCYLVRELAAFSKIALLARKSEIALEYAQKSEELKIRIMEIMWDDKDGFFYDRNIRAGKEYKSRYFGSQLNNSNERVIRVKSTSSLVPLYTRVATDEQARRIIYEHIFNAEEFFTPYPLSSLARSETGYSRHPFPTDLGCNWRANTWVPLNYMVYHGLKFYGYDQLASVIAHKTNQLVVKSGSREYYDAETGEGCGLDPFWGWSLLAYFMPFEEEYDLMLNVL